MQSFFVWTGGWCFEDLIAWLDRRIDHRDIPVGEAAEFLRKVINGLMARYGIQDVGVLALDRFRLRDEIEAKIQNHRSGERMVYEPSETYRGGFQFKLLTSTDRFYPDFICRCATDAHWPWSTRERTPTPMWTRRRSGPWARRGLRAVVAAACS